MNLTFLCPLALGAAGLFAFSPVHAQDRSDLGNQSAAKPASAQEAIPTGSRLLAGTTAFSDRASFNAAIGPSAVVRVEDFEEFAGFVGVNSLPGILNSTTDGGGVSPGDIEPGIEFNSLGGNGFVVSIYNGLVYIGNNTVPLAFSIALDPNVTVFGMDVQPAGQTQVTVRDAGGNDLGSLTSGVGFVGFTSDTPIASVRVEHTGGGGFTDIDNVTFGELGQDLAVTGSLAYGTCPEVLPLGRATCRVQATGTFNGESSQRHTLFLRVAETGRVAFRGEVKPQPGQTLSQSVQFRTLASDPAAFTLEMVVEEGSVAAPSSAATVLGTLAFSKGEGEGLRAAEGLTVFPNPATDAATLRFAVAEQTEAMLVVYDALGREVARPVDGVVTGAVEAAFDASGLPAGLYVARLTTEAGTQTVRLSVVR